MKNLSNEDFVRLVNTLKEEIEIKKAIEDHNKKIEQKSFKYWFLLFIETNFILFLITAIDLGLFYIIKYLWGIF